MDQSSGMAIGGVLVLLIAAVIGLALFGFWLWMLIHALTNRGMNGTEKLAWVLVVFFGSLIGAIVYFFVGKPKGG
jgi:uncharacterized membrane protein YhaH (DUF805 family)